MSLLGSPDQLFFIYKQDYQSVFLALCPTQRVFWHRHRTTAVLRDLSQRVSLSLSLCTSAETSAFRSPSVVFPRLLQGEKTEKKRFTGPCCLRRRTVRRNAMHEWWCSSFPYVTFSEMVLGPRLFHQALRWRSFLQLPLLDFLFISIKYDVS